MLPPSLPGDVPVSILYALWADRGEGEGAEEKILFPSRECREEIVESRWQVQACAICPSVL